MKKHTYNFGVIGNCAYLGMVGTDTNISWLCWPRFDSSFVFGGLLDEKKGGEFSVKPEKDPFEAKQYYIENTNVLCTEVSNSAGKYKITDFAPRFFQNDRYYKPLMLIRKIEPLEGTPRICVRCQPVGDYGKIKPSSLRGSNHVRYLGLDGEMRLTTNISLTYLMEEQGFVLNETKYLVLTFGPPLEASIQTTSENFLSKTIDYWRNWVKSTSIPNFHQAKVIRSALVLKIHQYEDTGAIIAASTTSLPESPGSGRNWDYRFCWMRDTFYTLNAFSQIGHFEELERYFHYIANVTYGQVDRYQPLYGISGSSKIIEEILDLEGYLGNKPVRIGNQAYTHVQNDVYGQVLLALLPLYVDNRFIGNERTESVHLIMGALKMIEKTINEPDAGLWEFRNLSQHHCYTFLFHWAGSNAAVKIARQIKHPEMEKLALRLRDEAIKMIESCYIPSLGVYSQAQGTTNMDASTLQLIMMRYLDPNSEKARSHLKGLEEALKGKNGLFYRYKHQDDFGAPESTFLICAFWYVEALACVGRLDEAIEIFEHLVEYGNHLGLLSEDIDERDGSQWGNFPQAYSHVGLMNAAYRISKKLDNPNFLS